MVKDYMRKKEKTSCEMQTIINTSNRVLEIPDFTPVDMKIIEEPNLILLPLTYRNSEAKFIYKNITNDYISYFTNLKDEDHVGSGTGIIVSRSLDAHIFNIMEYKGRIITLDF
uniref:Uncharacterized protein n=1 Tax=Rhizophagus irregularis (strain DAOM 181602 / DAOM 197198 / MUCL 43194) TaxID=747089 RepID=U9UCC1_RHIID